MKNLINKLEKKNLYKRDIQLLKEKELYESKFVLTPFGEGQICSICHLNYKDEETPHTLIINVDIKGELFSLGVEQVNNRFTQ